MTAAELGVLLGAAASLLVGLLGFLGRNVLSDLKALDARVVEQDKQIAVMGATRLGERVQKLEDDMSEIKGDLRVIRSWVEGQTGGTHMHRRASDK